MLGIKQTATIPILEVLPLFIDQAKDWCNNSFIVNGDEKLPAGVKLYVAKAIEHNMTPSNLSEVWEMSHILMKQICQAALRSFLLHTES